MTEENDTKPGAAKARRPIPLSPWLVLLGALVWYGVTLNHWVTLSSLPLVSQFTGWDWHPGTLMWRPGFEPPLYFLATYPVRLLPAVWRPLGLNLFTALCAGLTLAVLARTVRLLPQDRTKEQRQREFGEFGLLSMRQAFLPAAFAVLMLGMNLAFWQNAITASADMFDLLVFAFLILCLLEFRITQSEWRLNLFALVYGMGVTNNWALIGFFPCFLVALVWLRGRSFFNLRFILRMFCWGVLGLLLYFLTPLKGALAHDASFWELLHQEVGRQSMILRLLPRWMVIVVWAPILLPLIFAAVNWPSFEGDLNAGAHDLTRGMFRFIHLVFLALTSLMFFSTNYSPNPQRMGLPAFLTFNYLAALGVGYFSGYVLLVFGKQGVHRWARATGMVLLFNRAVVVLLWVAALGVPAMLCALNLPRIRALNSDFVFQFAQLMAQSVPANQTFVMGDDPIRLHLAQAALQREGKYGQYVFIETQSLPYPEYLRYLSDQYSEFGKMLNPEFVKMLKDRDHLPKSISTADLADLILHISMRGPVYYLHPSVGYFFERSRLVPRGLGGEVRPYADVLPALEVQTMTPQEIKTNQAFWRQVQQKTLDSWPDVAGVSPDAGRLAVYFSQDLNDWGVELQKAATTTATYDAGLLKDAGDQFTEAYRLNPQNDMARFNLQYNARLRNLPPPAAAGQLISAQDLAAKVSNWLPLLNTYGLADEPDLNLRIAEQMANDHDFFQAAQLFHRCLQLRPDDPNAKLDLAKTYIDLSGLLHDPNIVMDPALKIIQDLREHPATDSEEVVRVEAMAYRKKGDFAAADRLLAGQHKSHPKDETILDELVHFYRLMGYEAKQAGHQEDSQNYFNKALASIEEERILLNSPDTPSASATKLPGVMLMKSEMQMMLGQYEQAKNTLTQLVLINPHDPVPLLNRAIAELQANDLSAAKADYLALVKLTEDNPSFIIYYGLADIALKEKDAAEEARYLKLYLRYAPRRTVEYNNVTQRLQKLEGH